MSKLASLSLTTVLAASLVAGCSGSGGAKSETALKELGKNDKATIKVMYYDERQFFTQYGNLFLSKFPNIDLQVVGTNNLYKPNEDYNKTIEKFIEEQQPDVVMLQENQYEQYAGDGKLLELDGVIKQDKFDTAGIHPGILELLQSKGGGKLYGLAPEFNSQAIFYNKTVFDQYGVPYPKDQMSWDELFDLAKRFPKDGDKDKRVYGLYQQYDSGIFSTAMEIGHTNGLAIADTGSMKVTIQTDGWKKAFETALNAVKSEAMYRPSPEDNNIISGSMEDYYKRDLFIAGRAAMTLSGPYYLDSLNQAKDALKDTPAPNWDVVTVPVDPTHPDSGIGLSLNQIMAINAKSSNQRAAWEFVKYISSDDYAKIVSRSPLSGGMLSRTAYIKEKNGHKLEAFYKLKLNSGSLYQDYQKLPQSFWTAFEGLADTELKEVLNNKKALDDAIKNIQTLGQAQLDKAKEEEAKQATP